MSAYTHIFLRKNNEFLEVSCTGRSAAMSEMLGHLAPWERIREITLVNLNDIYHKYQGELNNWKKYIADINEKKQLVAAFNNSVSEKISALEDYDESIREVNETIDELSFALDQLVWLIQIAEDNRDNGIRIYVGCECGSHVTEADIEEKS